MGMTEAYNITYAEGVVEDLKQLNAGRRKQILDRIEVQLTHEPTRQTRNRKIIAGLVPPWEYVEPFWQLRIGEYRVC
jgi:mRNA-degrading endonuclease RelE of RelBE toxin-antitoxin system